VGKGYRRPAPADHSPLVSTPFGETTPCSGPARGGADRGRGTKKSDYWRKKGTSPHGMNSLSDTKVFKFMKLRSGDQVAADGY